MRLYHTFPRNEVLQCCRGVIHSPCGKHFAHLPVLRGERSWWECRLNLFCTYNATGRLWDTDFIIIESPSPLILFLLRSSNNDHHLKSLSNRCAEIQVLPAAAVWWAAAATVAIIIRRELQDELADGITIWRATQTIRKQPHHISLSNMTSWGEVLLYKLANAKLPAA